MPFVDISTKIDYASIYYTANTPFASVSAFDPEKPTVILLHPFLLDSSWLSSQFEDGRLGLNYNLIAFDRRSSGKSRCRPNGSHDSWVDAADLAFCHESLHLPPCHVLALESVAVNCALRFAVLFPEMCLSLILCNIPSSAQARWVNSLYREILRNWCFADDLAALEQAQVEAVKLIVGNDCSTELQDELIAYWQVKSPPTQRDRVLETFSVLLHENFLSDDILRSITQPVLIVHGDKNETYSINNAELLGSKLVNSLGNPVVYHIKGGGAALSLTPAASIANQVFSKFLARQSRVRSDLKAPSTALGERMRTALLQVADIMNDLAIAKRDPLSPVSFSCLPLDFVRSQNGLLAQYRQGRELALSPLRPDGRPIRRYSERHREHWFYAGKDGLSVAERPRIKNDPDRDRIPLSLRGESAEDAQGRKTPAGLNSGEKTTGKGLAKTPIPTLR